MNKEVIIIQKVAETQEENRKLFDYVKFVNIQQDDFYLLLIPFNADSIIRGRDFTTEDTNKMIKCVDDIKKLLEDKVKEDGDNQARARIF